MRVSRIHVLLYLRKLRSMVYYDLPYASTIPHIGLVCGSTCRPRLPVDQISGSRMLLPCLSDKLVVREGERESKRGGRVSKSGASGPRSTVCIRT